MMDIKVSKDKNINLLFLSCHELPQVFQWLFFTPFDYKILYQVFLSKFDFLFPGFWEVPKKITCLHEMGKVVK